MSYEPPCILYEAAAYGGFLDKGSNCIECDTTTVYYTGKNQLIPSEDQIYFPLVGSKICDLIFVFNFSLLSVNHGKQCFPCILSTARHYMGLMVGPWCRRPIWPLPLPCGALSVEHTANWILFGLYLEFLVSFPLYFLKSPSGISSSLKRKCGVNSKVLSQVGLHYTYYF